MAPTPVFLPGESRGQRSLAGHSPWGCKELDRAGKQKETVVCWVPALLASSPVSRGPSPIPGHLGGGRLHPIARAPQHHRLYLAPRVQRATLSRIFL